MAKMNAESNGIYQIVPVKILKARSQVVAGTLWRIKVAVGQSKCLKNVKLFYSLRQFLNFQQASSDGAESCAYEGNESKQQVYWIILAIYQSHCLHRSTMWRFGKSHGRSSNRSRTNWLTAAAVKKKTGIDGRKAPDYIFCLI